MEPKVESESHGANILGDKHESMEPACEGASAMEQEEKKPTCIIVLGMAGSGKTTFVQVNLYVIGKVTYFRQNIHFIYSRSQ